MPTSPRARRLRYALLAAAELLAAGVLVFLLIQGPSGTRAPARGTSPAAPFAERDAAPATSPDAAPDAYAPDGAAAAWAPNADLRGGNPDGDPSRGGNPDGDPSRGGSLDGDPSHSGSLDGDSLLDGNLDGDPPRGGNLDGDPSRGGTPDGDPRLGGNLDGDPSRGGSLDAPAPLPTLDEIVARFASRAPALWGEDLPGVLCAFPPATTDPTLALTFDACGGGSGAGYDAALIDMLIRQSVPATLFLSGRWIEANPDAFRALCDQPLFAIENHGEEHRPLSVTGRAQYGRAGTRDAAGVYREIERNAARIEAATGRRPSFFRAGTAYYDDVAIEIAAALRHQIAGYAIAADEGATLSADGIVRRAADAPSGSILLFHMNHPRGDTARGVEALLEGWQARGVRFVTLEEIEWTP